MKKQWLILGVVLLGVLAVWFLVKVFSGSLILSSVAFCIFGWPVHWYGIWIVLAFLLSYFLVQRWQGEGILASSKRLPDFLLGLFLFGIIFALLAFVLFNFHFFKGDFWSVFRFWEGGLTFYGGIFGGALFALLVRRPWKINVWKLGNLVAFILPLAQSVGRLGNFFNYEAYGFPTSLPWKMFVPLSSRLAGFSQQAFYHPLFLYEAIVNFFIFGLLYSFQRRTKANLFGWYLVFYSLFRFFLEFIRLDVLYWGFLTLGQWGSLAVMMVGVLLVIFWRNKRQ